MYNILVPKSKVKATQVIVNSWLKSSGVVTANEVVCQVQVGQEVFEIQSPIDGIIESVLVPAGFVAGIDEPLAVISPNVAEAEVGQEDEDSKRAGGKQMGSGKNAEMSESGDVTVIIMPQAGQSMEEGTVVAWKVAVGDRIEVGQVIFEIETDKAVMEVEAVNAGRIAKIVAQVGDIVEVKKPVAYLAEEGVDVDAFIAAQNDDPAQKSPVSEMTTIMPSASQSAVKAPSAVSDSGRVKASPAARKAANDKGIDLSSLGCGSGPGGRILSTDVESAQFTTKEPRTYPTTKMRRAIAKNLQYSKQTVPHFYVRATIDAQNLFNTYKATKEQFKCSVNDFIVLAVARSIKQYPAFRSQYRDTEIMEMPNANIGIAVGTDDGLTVPVVLAAETMSLEQLARRTREVVDSARTGKLEGVGQGVFTITNLGMFGTEEFSAIINPSESGILAVGAIREGVKAENGAIKATRLMTMTLSADHRVVDGVVAAQFMQTLGKMLENPQELIG